MSARRCSARCRSVRLLNNFHDTVLFCQHPLANRANLFGGKAQPAGLDYEVVILCGGKGTRLRETTEFHSKPMVEIGGKPILWHLTKFFRVGRPWLMPSIVSMLLYHPNDLLGFSGNHMQSRPDTPAANLGSIYRRLKGTRPRFYTVRMFLPQLAQFCKT